jgi:hypothetical protein
LCYAVDPHGARPAVFLHDAVDGQRAAVAAGVGILQFVLFQLRALFWSEE